MASDPDDEALEALRESWELAAVRHFFVLFGKKCVVRCAAAVHGGLSS